MLVLTRKVGESIIVGDDIEIRVVRIEGDQIRIGIIAPRSIPIVRGELLEEVRKETATAIAPPAALVASISKRMQKNAPQPAAAAVPPPTAK